MSRGIGLGAGAGAVSILAAFLAVSTTARSDAVSGKKVEKKITSADEDSPRSDRDVARRVRILGRGGAHLGIRLEDVDKDDVARLKLPEEKGALVKDVESDSPAAKAGIQEGDVIVRYHGESVIGASQLARLVRETPPGRTVPIEVVRNGATQKLSATVGDEGRATWNLGGDWGELEMPLPEPPDHPLPPSAPVPPHAFDRWGKRAFLDDLMWGGRSPRRLGLEYQEISGQLAQYFKIGGDTGVLVTSVDADGPAGKAGLKAGDVILKVGSRAIEDGEDLRKALDRAEPGAEIAVSVQREGRTLDFQVTLAGERRKQPAREL
jgi:serine protease Do